MMSGRDWTCFYGVRWEVSTARVAGDVCRFKKHTHSLSCSPHTNTRIYTLPHRYTRLEISHLYVHKGFHLSLCEISTRDHSHMYTHEHYPYTHTDRHTYTHTDYKRARVPPSHSVQTCATVSANIGVPQAEPAHLASLKASRLRLACPVAIETRSREMGSFYDDGDGPRRWRRRSLQGVLDVGDDKNKCTVGWDCEVLWVTYHLCSWGSGEW